MKQIKNPAHAFIERVTNEVRNLYNTSYNILYKEKKYPKNSIEYKIYKYLLIKTQEVLKELKLMRTSIIETYHSTTWKVSPNYLYIEVVKDVTKLLADTNNIVLNLSGEIIAKSLI